MQVGFSKHHVRKKKVSSQLGIARKTLRILLVECLPHDSGSLTASPDLSMETLAQTGDGVSK